MQKRIGFVVLGIVQGVMACSDTGGGPPSSPGNAGTAGTTTAAGSATGGVAGSAAGAVSTGGGGASVGGGGASVGGGGAGSGGAGAPAAGAGGSSGSSSAGGMANGGAGGTANGGTGGGGMAGGGVSGGGGAGGSPLTAIASELHQFRLECPCIDANHFGSTKQDNCDQAQSVDRQTHPKQLGGDPNVVYDVKLRVRGNTEPNTYVNGKLEQGRFYIGGQTSTPGYTAYMLTVADPPQTYFFNYNATTGHIHFLIDYEVVIPMRGGTKVTFEVNGGKSVPDGHGVSNRESLVVPGIPPAPDPFNGQLVQFDVVSVQARAQ